MSGKKNKNLKDQRSNGSKVWKVCITSSQQIVLLGKDTKQAAILKKKRASDDFDSTMTLQNDPRTHMHTHPISHTPSQSLSSFKQLPKKYSIKDKNFFCSCVSWEFHAGLRKFFSQWLQKN